MTVKFDSLGSVGTDGQQEDTERLMSDYDGASETLNRGQPTQVYRTKVAPVGESADELEAEEEKPDEDKPQQPAPAAGAQDGLAALLQLAAGQRAVEDVQLKAAPSSATKGAFSTAVAERAPAPRESIDELMGELGLPPAAAPAPKGSLGASLNKLGQAAGPSAAASTAMKTPTKRAAKRAEQAAAPSAEGADQGDQKPQNVAGSQSGVVGVPKTAVTVGELAGRAVAGAVMTPFLALSSARRHLKSSVPKNAKLPQTLQPGPASVNESVLAGAGVTSPAQVLNTGKFITTWKCERIEASAKSLAEAADALREVDEFPVWEEKVSKLAEARNQSVEQVIHAMHIDPDLAELKNGMDKIWEQNPSLVGNYQDACEVFSNHMRNVVKEFPNSDDKIKARVSAAARQAQVDTKDLPGFGDNIGEYQRSVAERVREIVAQMMALVESLMAKLGGKSAGTELAP